MLVSQENAVTQTVWQMPLMAKRWRRIIHKHKNTVAHLWL